MKRTVLCVVGAAGIAAGAFWGGMQYGQSTARARTRAFEVAGAELVDLATDVRKAIPGCAVVTPVTRCERVNAAEAAGRLLLELATY